MQWSVTYKLTPTFLYFNVSIQNNIEDIFIELSIFLYV